VVVRPPQNTPNILPFSFFFPFPSPFILIYIYYLFIFFFLFFFFVFFNFHDFNGCLGPASLVSSRIVELPDITTSSSRQELISSLIPLLKTTRHYSEEKVSTAIIMEDMVNRHVKRADYDLDVWENGGEIDEREDEFRRSNAFNSTSFGGSNSGNKRKDDRRGSKKRKIIIAIIIIICITYIKHV